MCARGALMGAGSAAADPRTDPSWLRLKLPAADRLAPRCAENGQPSAGGPVSGRLLGIPSMARCGPPVRQSICCSPRVTPKQKLAADSPPRSLINALLTHLQPAPSWLSQDPHPTRER